MKKTIFFIIGLCIAQDASAKWRNENGTCYIDTYHKYAFICGNSAPSKCDGKKLNKYKQINLYAEGECFAHDVADNKPGTFAYMCCCGGQFRTVNPSDMDTSKKTWFSTQNTEIDIDGGTCTYTKKTNACGTEITKPCTKPTGCSNGLILRNGKCIELCPNGQAFEKFDNNTCISCETTMYQGIDYSQKIKNPDQTDTEIDDKICVTCDPDTQFFDKETKKCIDKKSMTTVSKEDMKLCAFCPNTESFKQCLSCAQNFDSTTCQQTKKDCFIPD